MRPLRVRLLFTLVTGAFALGAAELGLRALGEALLTPRRADPSAAGQVGAEGARTLVCAGDSVTFGYGLSRDDAWPAKLARRPAVVEAGIRVVNVGIPGQKLWQIAQAMNPALDGERGRERAAVVLGGHNDCATLGVPLPTASSALVTRARAALRSLTTYRLLAQVVARARRAPLATPGEERVAGCAASIEAGVGRVREVADRTDTPLLFTTYPVAEDGRGIVSAYVNGAVLDAADAAGVPAFDLAACLERRGAAGGLQEDGVHLTAAGADAVAACLEEPVLRLFAAR